MRFPALGLVIFLIALGLDLEAQSPNASITGEVTDASKALIVGSNVLAVSESTGAEYETESGSSGLYRLANLPPRNTLTCAVSYDVPGPQGVLLKQLFGGWSTDAIVYARSAAPVNVVTGNNPFPYVSLSGTNGVQRPNVNAAVAFYLRQPGAPGRKVLNSAAFSAPTPSTTQGNLGRNLVGFDIAPAISPRRVPFAASKSRLFQCSESPQLRQPDKLSQLATVWRGDTDVEQSA
jgi:hypothetical protein